jgi:hypothetical protein
MPEVAFTLIDDGHPLTVTVTSSDGTIRLSPERLQAALGYELKPESLCRGNTCFPVTDRASLLSDAGVDLARCADIVDRPLAIDVAERVAYIGVSAADRSTALVSGCAPDFTLPDLDGRLHSLSDYRGRKVLLVAHASW